MKAKTGSVVLSLLLLCVGCDSSLPGWFRSSPFGTSSGALTEEEIRKFTSNISETMGEEIAMCLAKQAMARAEQIGDPQTLNPDTVALLPVEQWDSLDRSGKRLILTQVVINQAIPVCTQAGDH